MKAHKELVAAITMGFGYYLDHICFRRLLHADWSLFRPVIGMLTTKCCDEPVETIDWLSLSLRWHVAYLVAASPNPKPRDDVLYKDSV